MAIHHIEVEKIGFFFDFRYLFAEPGEIGRQQAGGDPIGWHPGVDCIGLVIAVPGYETPRLSVERRLVIDDRGLSPASSPGAGRHLLLAGRTHSPQLKAITT